MNIKQIKELAQLLKQNELSALEVVEGDSRVRLERETRTDVAAAPQAATSAPVRAVQGAVPPVVPMPDAGVDFNNATPVKSPIVGVFYAAPTPEAEPFVRVGSKVNKGDVLCIVEAMKLMNEIVAEQAGEIVDICAQNGDVVEFGQTLFKLN